jgi:hypothetical protein
MKDEVRRAGEPQPAQAGKGRYELKPAQKAFVSVVWANPKPEVTAIVESRQRAKPRTRPHGPEVVLDSLEAEGFQAGLLLPKQKVLARAQGILPGMPAFSIFGLPERKAMQSHAKPPQGHLKAM